MSEEFPEEEEYVVATVENITRFGAYLKLEDYSHTAFLPISEVSSRWVRRISDIIRVGERVVVKVIRVDKKTKTVDVSLKDVPIHERRSILAEWERNRKGRKLVRTFAEKSKIDPNLLMEKLSPLIEKKTTVYEALENIIIDPEVLNRVDIPNEIKKKFLEFLIKRIKPREYVLRAVISVSYKGKGGVRKIKKFLNELKKRAEDKKLKISITLMASPKYLVRISSYRPEYIKRYASKILKNISSYSTKLGVNYMIIEERLEK